MNADPLSAPVASLSLREQIYRRLRNAMMQGHYRPGTAIKISELAETFRTSAVPVREALQYLAAEGAIELLPNRSARIPHLTLSEFLELMRLRVTLESMAAEQAAPLLTDEAIAGLEASNAEMKRAVAAEDLAAILRLNQAFHFGLYEASGSRILVGLIGTLWLRAGPMLTQSFRNVAGGLEMHASGTDRHLIVVDALRRHDPRAVGEAIAHDLREAADWYLDQYDFAEADTPAADPRRKGEETVARGARRISS